MYIWYDEDVLMSDLYDNSQTNLYTNINVANIVTNKYAGINKLPFCEYESETMPSETTLWKVETEYKQSTNKRFKNAVFITPDSSVASHYYTNIKSQLGTLNVGDRLNIGCFVYIRSEQKKVRVARYFSLNNSVHEYVLVDTNKWVLLSYRETVTDKNRGLELRTGFYIPANTGIESIEMTGMYAYVNYDIDEYIPYYNDILGKGALFEKTFNATVNFIEGNNNLNLVPYCEFKNTEPSNVTTSGLTVEYKQSTNARFAKSAFITPKSTNFYYFISDSNLKSQIKVGDKIKVGFWMKVSADWNTPQLVRLYNGIDNYASNHQYVTSNEWKFYLSEYEITTISDQDFRFGIYVDRTPIDVEQIELTGLTLYINQDLNTYSPYYIPIEERTKEYTNNAIENLKNDASFYSDIVNIATQNTIDVIDGKNVYNMLTYCELERDIPTVGKTNGISGIRESTNPEFKNALFFSPSEQGTASYVFTADSDYAHRFVKAGDKVKVGFWAKINSSSASSILVYGLYRGFYNTINENNLRINTNEWVFIIREQTLSESTVNQQFRCGFYFNSGNVANIDSVEITGLCLYVNKDVGIYMPYYTPIEDRAKEYTDEKIAKALTKSGGVKGANISRFLSKVWSKQSSYDDIYRQPTIKVSMIGDSIVNSIQASPNKIENILATQYPNVRFEYMHVALGGMRAAQMMPKVWEIINWNPDLIIYGEWEDYIQSWKDRHYWESIIRLFRDYSQADIALFAHSIVQPSAEFLAANDIQGYLTGTYSQTHRVRSTFMSIAKKYNCEFMDFQQPIIEGLLDGTYTVSNILNDFVHPTTLACQIWGNVMKQHFVPIWEHETYAQVTGVNPQKTYYLQEAITMPDIKQFRTTGNWSRNVDCMLKSDANDSTIELESESCSGWQLVYKNTGKNFSLLIDGKQPSDVLPQYATQPTGNQFAKIQKVEVSGLVLADQQSEHKYKLVVTGLTRNAGSNNKLTELKYNLVDVANGTVLQTGCDAFADTIVNIGAGSLLIPKEYAGQQNIIDSGYDVNYPEPPANVIRVGDEFEFSVKKNYHETVTTTSDGSVGIINIFPLKKGIHSNPWCI